MKKVSIFTSLLLLIAFTMNGQEVNRPNEKVKTTSSKTEVSKSGMSQKEIIGARENTGVKVQGIRMSNGSATTCFGEFFDSGGPTGSYQVNENYTYTIVSETEGAHFILRFVEFFLSEGDALTVYDGSSTAAKVIGTFSKSNPMPFELKSTGGNLTFVFTSDAQGNGSGWRASIGCYVGERKVLKTDGMAPSVTLFYAVNGVKSEADAQLIEDMLSKNEYILKSDLDREKNTISVVATTETYKDVILEQIRSSEEFLGYEITAGFRDIIHSKPQQ